MAALGVACCRAWPLARVGYLGASRRRASSSLRLGTATWQPLLELLVAMGIFMAASFVSAQDAPARAEKATVIAHRHPEALVIAADTIVVIDGDGSLLMNLGTLSTMARYRPDPRILELGDHFYDAVRPAEFPKAIPRFCNRRWAERVGLCDANAGRVELAPVLLERRRAFVPTP